MLLRSGLAGLGLVVATLAFQGPASRPSDSGKASGTYSVDPVHSSVVFRVKHLNTSYFYGRFNDVHGSASLDESAPGNTSLDVEIKADSIDTNNTKRDAHIKGPDFLNVAKFPAITFKSKTCTKSGENAFEIAGDLTLHGVTKPLKVTAEKTGSNKGPRGALAGFETVFTVKRSDFGITFMPDGLGDEIRVILSLECHKK